MKILNKIYANIYYTLYIHISDSSYALEVLSSCLELGKLDTSRIAGNQEKKNIGKKYLYRNLKEFTYIYFLIFLKALKLES